MQSKFIPMAFLLSLSLSTSIYATDEEEETIKFHVINDGQAKHISMIPSKGYDSHGDIKPGYNPNSIVYQHAALLENLRQEQLDLDKEAEEEALVEIELEQRGTSQAPNTRKAKSKGNIFLRRAANQGVLDELIQLEKRAGRTKK